MNLIDIRESSGPYWAAYQETRKRDCIMDNPDMVPEWFLVKLAGERVAAARIAAEKIGGFPNGLKVHSALRTLEDFLRFGCNIEGERDQIVAGLLGAEEAETERQRAELLPEQEGRP